MSTDFDLLNIFGIIPLVWEVIHQSLIFTVVKWFLFVYTAVLLIDVFLLLVTRGVTENLKMQFYGTARPILSKNKATERFQAIEQRLESDNVSQYKAAVLEADHFADEVLRESGYAGSNMGERLAGIHSGQLLSYESLKAAHAVRNRIVNEPNFPVTREDATNLLQQYRAFFEEMELFS